MFEDSGYRVRHTEVISVTNEHYETYIASLEEARRRLSMGDADFTKSARAYQNVIEAGVADS